MSFVDLRQILCHSGGDYVEFEAAIGTPIFILDSGLWLNPPISWFVYILA